jgi:D-serine deaminase-like pyridoxal phosphate-dependent protein
MSARRMNTSELQTPGLLLDRAKVARNIAVMHEGLARHDVSLRLHGKTAKTIDIVRMTRTTGLAVSTLKEAEYYFDHGVTDIIYAVGIAPVKLDRVVGLIRKGADVTVLLDSVEQADFVAAKAVERQVAVPALIELDCDGHRSGVPRGDSRLLAIAHRLERGGVELRGVLTHAGESYHCRTVDEIRAIAETERDTAVEAAGILRANGLPCPVVSVGSTPTATFAGDLTGVTEVRAGVFVFQDLTMVGLGVCAVEDIAVSVLASVIGHQRDRGWVVVDAGWTALSQDPGADRSYGRVCDLAGVPIGDTVVTMTNQEHGVIAARDGEIDWDRFAIGERVRILPNHACATCTMHDRYHVVDGGAEIVDQWDRFRGW